MLKSISVIAVALVLTGCATHQQANTAVGAVTGAVVGRAVAGHGGAVAGAIVGSIIGSEQPTRQYHAPPPVVVVPRYERVYPDYSMCNQWYYQERQACFRGAEARARQEQNIRNREAYNTGRYGR